MSKIALDMAGKVVGKVRALYIYSICLFIVGSELSYALVCSTQGMENRDGVNWLWR